MEVAKWQLVGEPEAKNSVLGRDVLPNTLYRLLQLANRLENLKKLRVPIDGTEGRVMTIRIPLERNPALTALLKNTTNEEEVASYIVAILNFVPTYANLNKLPSKPLLFPLTNK